MLGLAGVAAAAAVVGLVGTDLLRAVEPVRRRRDRLDGDGRALDDAPARPSPRRPRRRAAAEGVDAMPPMHIQMSSTRYTAAGFAAQAGALAATPGQPVKPLTGEPPSVGPIATPIGLAGCLRALGVGPVDEVTADLGFYEGVRRRRHRHRHRRRRAPPTPSGGRAPTGNQAVLHAGVPVS